MSEIGHRKNDHINAILKSDVRSRKTTGLEAVVFEHVALPEQKQFPAISSSIIRKNATLKRIYLWSAEGRGGI